MEHQETLPTYDEMSALKAAAQATLEFRHAMYVKIVETEIRFKEKRNPSDKSIAYLRMHLEKLLSSPLAETANITTNSGCRISAVYAAASLKMTSGDHFNQIFVLTGIGTPLCDLLHFNSHHSVTVAQGAVSGKYYSVSPSSHNPPQRDIFSVISAESYINLVTKIEQLEGGLWANSTSNPFFTQGVIKSPINIGPMFSIPELGINPNTGESECFIIHCSISGNNLMFL